MGPGAALNNHVLCMDSNTSELYQKHFNKSNHKNYREYYDNELKDKIYKF